LAAASGLPSAHFGDERGIEVVSRTPCSMRSCDAWYVIKGVGFFLAVCTNVSSGGRCSLMYLLVRYRELRIR
jgi:hypothetical protein